MEKIDIKNTSRGYILITPAKNEEKNMSLCIQSVAEQTIMPNLWVIVDDGSTDKTFKIIQEAKEKYPWIECIQLLSDTKRDRSIHISEVINIGLNSAIDRRNNPNLKYNYIAFLDADMIVQDKNFFEKLIIKLEGDSQLGIASGEIEILENSRNSYIEKRRADTISGGEMMCRQEIFHDIYGVPSSYAWESVLRVKTILKGWKVRRFNDIKVIQTRKTGGAEGLKKGYYVKGASEYYLGFNPLLVAAKGIIYCLKRPHYIGFAYLYGYFSSLIRRKDKINDKEIKKYFYYCKLNEIWRYYFNNLFRRT